MDDSQGATVDDLRKEISRLTEEKRQLESAWFELQSANPKKDHREVLEEIARAGVDVLRAEAAGVYVIDFETEELVFEAVIGGGGPTLQSYRMPLGQGIPGLVAATGQAYIVANAETDGRVARPVVEVTGYQPRSVLCVPMFFQSRVIGALGFYDKQAEGGFAQGDISVASAFASIASQVLGHSLLRDKSAHSANGVAPLAQASHLVELVSQLAFSGEAEMRLCIQILGALSEYARSQKTR